MFKHLIKWKEECVNEYIVLFLCVQTGLLNKKKYKKQIKNNKTSHNGKISSNNQRELSLNNGYTERKYM